MPPAWVQCQFCGKTFLKRANLYRHLNSNSCTARPNPDTVRPRCRFCNGRFKSQRVLNQHLSRNKCAVQRSHPRERQEQNSSPQQQFSQLPPELSSMTRQQQIGLVTNILAMNDARVVQNVLQSVLAMAGTTVLNLPARSRRETEAAATQAAELQASSKEPPNGPPRPNRKEERK